ncbi:isochorismatase family protein [Azospirillum sp. BE72]|uniref:isochorismatase family protein n=1 Tax=Azospirillum sp. BE72 TaxID=2817776 RepID=UPI002865F232|nr:isochorismatase family protein [Azospirillum sp. BE72]MDR6774084.1 nicotinamidase-related amidase [Azospirillum sp. BE72]
MNTLLDRRALFRGGIASASLITLPAMASGAEQRTAGSSHAAIAGALIDYNDVQVLFADLQTSLVAGSRTTSPSNIGRSAGALAKVARILKLPSIFSVVPERQGEPQLISELEPFAVPANTFERTFVGSLMDARTADAIAASGRRTLVIAGFAAEGVVLQTALDALNSGYRVQLAVDAIGGLTQRSEDAALRHAEFVGAVPTSVVSLATRMTPDLFHTPGSEVFAAIMPLL